MRKLHLVAIVAALAMVPASARAACFGCTGALTQTKSATFNTATLGTNTASLLSCVPGQTGRSATVEWTAATSATGYSLFRNGGTGGSKRYNLGAVLSYTDTIPDSDLQNVSYTYYVEGAAGPGTPQVWTSNPSNSLVVNFTAAVTGGGRSCSDANGTYSAAVGF